MSAMDGFPFRVDSFSDERQNSYLSPYPPHTPHTHTYWKCISFPFNQNKEKDENEM